MSDEIETVRGPHVPLTVVAAKKRGEWIVRGWMPFKAPTEIRREVERIDGVLDPEIEWTTYTYELPAYLVYGHEDLEPGWGWPVGIYKWPCSSVRADVYRGPVECLRKGHGTGLGEVFGMCNA